MTLSGGFVILEALTPRPCIGLRVIAHPCAGVQSFVSGNTHFRRGLANGLALSTIGGRRPAEARSATVEKAATDGADWILKAMVAVAGSDGQIDERETGLIQQVY